MHGVKEGKIAPVRDVYYLFLFIHPSRGCSLDAAITMFRRMGGRVLLMSGTFSNAGEVSVHLDADLFISRYERTKLVRNEIHAPDDLEALPKPRKLAEAMVPTDSGYAYNKNSLRLQKLRELLAEKEGASAIVFVPTKAQGYCLSHALKVPFHCKDVPEEEKKTMTADFRAGRIKTIAATDTLSQGINTPADISVVCGGRRGGYYLDSNDVRQREGRAGRGKDSAESFLIGDKIELFHMKKEVYTKTLPLPTEEMLLTLLCMKNITREEICSALLSTFAATLINRQKVIEAVNRYINFLSACRILKEKSGRLRLTEEGALLARYFIPPRAYMGYIRLARKLTEYEMNDVERGCILLSTLMQSLPSQGCPPRYEKDFQMKFIKMEMDKELSASRAGILRHYIEKPSAIPAFLGGSVREVERWLAMLSDMEKYKIHEQSPGKQWLDSTLEGLKINILKMLSRKRTAAKTQPSTPPNLRLPFEGVGS
jgi:replicative superfamily II helicase